MGWAPVPLAFVVIGTASALSWAGSTDPSGLWQSPDSRSGGVRAEVRLEVRDGLLEGHIVRVVSARDAVHPVCHWCSGNRKDSPFVGMTLLEGLQRSSKDPLLWEDGRVLDPDTGRLFRARVRMDPSGANLELRGYFGIPLNGKSQIWRRLE